MSYFVVEDFAAGLDVRKSAVTARPGTLQTARNVFINAGGEIEKRGAFLKLATFDAGSFGLAERDGELIHFAEQSGVGITLAPQSQLAAQVNLTVLTRNAGISGAAGAIQYVSASEPFGPNAFTCVRYSDNRVRYFYNGAEVDTGFNLLNFPLAARTHRSKLYAGAGNILRFSAIEDGANWLTGAGRGLVDIAFAETGNPKIINVQSYYDRLALLGERSVQIWLMDQDPARNQILETLENTGAVGHQSAATYGTGDVLFLSTTGIRSIRARDSSNAAVLNDIGSPIDPLIQARNPARLLPDETFRIIALVDPPTGHFWLIWGSTIYVLAFYPNSKVTAWTTFELPFTVDHAVVMGERVYLRSGNDLYGYYTNLSSALDASQANAQATLPFLTAGQPATFKTWTGLDVACSGNWKVEVATDPTAPDAWDHVATVNGTTYSLKRIPFHAYTTHCAVRFTAQDTAPGKIGAVALHLEGGEAA